MYFFKKSSLKNILLLFTFLFSAFTQNQVFSSIENQEQLIKLQNLGNEIDQLGQETLTFLDHLNTILPQMVHELQNTNNMTIKLLQTFFELYKDVITIFDLRDFQCLQNGTISEKLVRAVAYITIECLLATSISNLETKRQMLPSQHIQSHQILEATIIENNKKIDSYKKEVKTRVEDIKTTVNDTLATYFGFDIAENRSTQATAEILNALNYKALLNMLKIQDTNFRIQLEQIIINIISNVLDQNDLSTLETVIKSKTFNKIKTNTTTQTALKFITCLLPAATNEIIAPIKKILFTPCTSTAAE